jgi:hypothetical protein
MIAEECKTKKTFYICSFCDRDYKNYNSLGNHNRKFHPKDTNEKLLGCVSKCSSKLLGCVSESSSILLVNNTESLLEINKSLTCESCNKVFTPLKN